MVLTDHVESGKSYPGLLVYDPSPMILPKCTSDALRQNVKVDDDVIYAKLAKLLRNIHDKTDRRSLKVKLSRLYEKATKDDVMMIEIF